MYTNTLLCECLVSCPHTSYSTVQRSSQNKTYADKSLPVPDKRVLHLWSQAWPLWSEMLLAARNMSIRMRRQTAMNHKSLKWSKMPTFWNLPLPKKKTLSLPTHQPFPPFPTWSIGAFFFGTTLFGDAFGVFCGVLGVSIDSFISFPRLTAFFCGLIGLMGLAGEAGCTDWADWGLPVALLGLAKATTVSGEGSAEVAPGMGFSPRFSDIFSFGPLAMALWLVFAAISLETKNSELNMMLKWNLLDATVLLNWSSLGCEIRGFSLKIKKVQTCEPQKKTSYFPFFWFNRDPYNGLSSSQSKWVSTFDLSTRETSCTMDQPLRDHRAIPI